MKRALPPALALLCLAAAARAAAPTARECAAHAPVFTLPSPPPGADCVRLLRHPPRGDAAPRFARCRNETCFLFVQEDPFVLLPPGALGAPTPARLARFQRPFACGRPHELHPQLAGIAFQLHARTSSRDALCVWAGPGEACTFNALVDFVDVMARQEPPYRFAVTGMLLETKQRYCRHHPSASFLDNKVVIVGRAADGQDASHGPLYQLIRPFRWSTWCIFAAAVCVCVLVCFYIAARFHVLPGRPFVTAFYILAGERESAMSTDNIGKQPAPPPRRRRRRRHHHLHLPRLAPARRSSAHADDVRRSPLGSNKYGLALTLFSAALVALGSVFALFYEVAVVNFLFQQRNMALDKSVKTLSVSELKRYSVLKNSALEEVWDAAVNSDGRKYESYPWSQCASVVDCMRWAADEDSPVDFDVTSDVSAKNLIAHDPLCKGLTMFSTKDMLYQFSGGWLYSRAVDAEFRRLVDVELVGLRMSGEVQRLLDEANGGFLAERSVPADIGPLIVLIPLAIFVLPPLAGAVAVMTCWPRARKEGRAPRRRGRGRDAPSESVSGDSSAAEAVGARAGGGDAVGGGQAEEADLAHV